MQSYPLLKISTIADPAHVSDVMSILRFTQITKPIISSRIIRSQVEETNGRVALAILCLFWTFRSNKLNLSATEAPFQENTWLSFSQTTFMTVNNVKLFTQALTYMSSGIHGIWKKLSEHRFTTLRGYVWRFLSKTEHCNIVSKEFWKFLPLFTISALSNNDITNGVPGYFKCH